MEVQLYSKSGCPFCVKAKSWFDDHGISFSEIVLDDEEQRLQFYQRLNGVKETIAHSARPVNSMPQIFVDGKRLGGYDDLMNNAEKMMKKLSGGLMKPSIAYKPFFYPWAVEITTRHEKAHWIEDEVDLSEDVTDWKTGRVTEVEKDYITNILRLFTQSDVEVGKNYFEHFIPKFKNSIKINEIKIIPVKKKRENKKFLVIFT